MTWRKMAWNTGNRLDITSHFLNDGREELRTALRFVAVPYQIPRRCVAAYFPEANVLVPIASVALKSNTPTSKAVVVSLTLSQFHSDSAADREVSTPAQPFTASPSSQSTIRKFFVNFEESLIRLPII